MNHLIDTCVISEFTKPRPNPSVVHWLEVQDEMTLYLSVISLGEIQKGISKLEDSSRQQTLRDWLEDLMERFDGRILPIDADVMLAWGELVGTEQCRGVNLPTIDSLIAATAITHDMPVVSRNVHDLQRCHVTVVNPWE